MAYSSPVSKTHSNLYENLYESDNEDEESPTSNPIRKARKKLREIEALENKPNKTMEEYKKIDQKEYYQAIVCPLEIPLDPYQEKITIKKKKEFKRIEQQQKKKISSYVEELREKKDTIRTLEKEKTDIIRTLEKEKTDIIRTFESQQKSLEEENAQLRYCMEILHDKLSKTMTSSSIDISSIIRNEYEQLSGTKGSKKAWRDLMLKYHSDKTKKVLGFEVSNAIAKIATDLKPEY